MLPVSRFKRVGSKGAAKLTAWPAGGQDKWTLGLMGDPGRPPETQRMVIVTYRMYEGWQRGVGGVCSR